MSVIIIITIINYDILASLASLALLISLASLVVVLDSLDRDVDIVASWASVFAEGVSLVEVSIIEASLVLDSFDRDVHINQFELMISLMW